MFPLGEYTLALDEEMLQVLDAVDAVKPAADDALPPAVNRCAQEEPAASSSSAAFARPLAPVSDGKRESDRALCKRPGWRADCKDLAQRLLFSEDLEEVEHAPRVTESMEASQASAFTKWVLAYTQLHSFSFAPVIRFVLFLLTTVFLLLFRVRLKATSRGKSKDKSGPNTKADPPLDVSRDYIMFSPTRLAAAMKKAKLQQSLQNQSTSVLTVPSGFDLSTLNDTLPQPGEVICDILLRVTDSFHTLSWLD